MIKNKCHAGQMCYLWITGKLFVNGVTIGLQITHASGMRLDGFLFFLFPFPFSFFLDLK